MQGKVNQQSAGALFDNKSVITIDKSMKAGSIHLVFRVLLATLAMIAMAGCTKTPAPDDVRIIALVNATIIDGTGAAPVSNQTIIIRGSKIAQIDDAASIDVPLDAEIIDASGKWVIPGFVDLHVHLPPDETVHGAILERLLEHGVTSFLNPGARPEAGVPLRERIQAGDFPGPQMKTAGRLIDDWPETSSAKSWAAHTPTQDALREEIRAQAKAGVDFIKLYARLSPELVAAGIEEGHAQGLPVIGHLEATNWTDAAAMGIDMLVHTGWSAPMDELVNLVNPESASDEEWYLGYADAPNGPAFQLLVDTLIENDIVVVPTLAVMQAGGLGDDNTLLPLYETDLAPERDLEGWWGEGWRTRHPEYSDDVGSEEAQLLKEVYFPALLNFQKEFYERGVTLGVGTDVGVSWMTPGASFHYEMSLYQDAGIPPLAILSMATRNGADALGLGDAVGTIEIGKNADLIVLGADPSADIRNAREIERVFLAGQEISRP